MSVELFIGSAIKEIIEAGVFVSLEPDRFVYSPGEAEGCSGYFQECRNAPSVFKVATKKPFAEFLEIFVHEYCHFQQWKYNENNIWTDEVFKMPDGRECLEHIFDCFNGKIEYSLEELKNMCARQVLVEIDCERRAYKKIEEFNLPIDKKQYAKKANAYTVFYFAMPYLRSWYKTPPYNIPEIVAEMPEEIILAGHEEIALRHLDLFRKTLL